MGDLTFQFRAGEFFQNNPFILPHMVDHVVGEAKSEGARFLVDAYCGSGLFALSAAASFEQVAGVEVSDQAVLWAQANVGSVVSIMPAFLSARPRRFLKDSLFLLRKPLLLADPPRKGCDESFRSTINGLWSGKNSLCFL